MKVISVIEDEDVIKKILKHLGLWELKACPPSFWRARPPPGIRLGAKRTETIIDDSFSQLPAKDDLSRASSSNEWLYVDPEHPEVYSLEAWHTRLNV